MSKQYAYTFVNECRNMVWLSGYARPQPDGTVLLYQSSNEATAIPMRPGKNVRFPAPHLACEVRCHAVGVRDPDTNVSEILLTAVSVKRASVTTVPKTRTLINAFRDRASAAANPFAPRDEVMQEIRDNLKFSQDAVDMLLNGSAAARPGFDGYVNRVLLSGFVGHKAFIAPRDDGTGDLGRVRFMLMQSADPSAALVVDVRGADSRFGKELRELHPLTVIGRTRVVVDRDAEGAITRRYVGVETERSTVGLATLTDFAAKAWPEWWRDAVSARLVQRRELSARNEAQVAAQRQAPPAAPVEVTPEAATTPLEEWGA